MSETIRSFSFDDDVDLELTQKLTPIRKSVQLPTRRNFPSNPSEIHCTYCVQVNDYDKKCLLSLMKDTDDLADENDTPKIAIDTIEKNKESA